MGNMAVIVLLPLVMITTPEPTIFIESSIRLYNLVIPVLARLIYTSVLCQAWMRSNDIRCVQMLSFSKWNKYVFYLSFKCYQSFFVVVCQDINIADAPSLCLSLSLSEWVRWQWLHRVIGPNEYVNSRVLSLSIKHNWIRFTVLTLTT